jgi:hypothetical protein
LPSAVFFFLFASREEALDPLRLVPLYGEGSEEEDVRDGACCRPSGSLRFDSFDKRTTEPENTISAPRVKDHMS